MGIGFVILIQLFFLLIISSIFAFFSGIITSFVANGEKKRRKILLSIFIPFHLFFSFYIFGIIGSIIVSETKKVDIGIGDSWYAPIDESYQILMIDLPEQAYIECNGETILSEVSEIQQIEKKVIGKTHDENYFSLNLINKKLTEYKNLEEFKNGENLTKLNFTKVEEFYQNKKREVSGNGMIFVGILSLITSILTAIIIYKFIVYGKTLGIKK
jgi:hypothetical protein